MYSMCVFEIHAFALKVCIGLNSVCVWDIWAWLCVYLRYVHLYFMRGWECILLCVYAMCSTCVWDRWPWNVFYVCIGDINTWILCMYGNACYVCMGMHSMRVWDGRALIVFYVYIGDCMCVFILCVYGPGKRVVDVECFRMCLWEMHILMRWCIGEIMACISSVCRKCIH